MLYGLLLLSFQQDGGFPPPPEPLNSEPVVLSALEVLESKVDYEESRLAIQSLLEALSTLPPVQQANYLMEVMGNSLFPPGLDLSREWSELQTRWPQLKDHLDQLVHGEVDLDRLNGAMLAAAYLEISSIQMVEAIAARLNEEGSADYARQALFQLTKHEFVDAGAFNEWWKSARNQSRETWLASAFDKAHAREIALWSRLLVADGAAAIDASKSPLKGVRLLAFSRMAELPQVQSNEDSPFKAAVREAFYAENIPQLREQIIALIPRFLLADEAIPLLDQALESSRQGERLVAAQSLVRVRPVEAARGALLRHLRRVYVHLDGEVKDSAQFRSALWIGLKEVADPGGEADAELSAVIVKALETESEQQTRNDIYLASGALAWGELIDVLLLRASDAELPIAERSSALAALTRIALVNDGSEKLLSYLHTLLGHEDLRYRAVQCLRDLKSATSATPLAEQLSMPMEGFVAKAILAALSELPPSTEAITRLLKFLPTTELEGAYLTALSSQLSGVNSQVYLSAVQGLEERPAYRLALKLMDKLGDLDLSAADLLKRDEIYVRSLAKWILQADTPAGAAGRVSDCRSRLEQQIQLHPEVSVWAEILVQLNQEFPVPVEPEPAEGGSEN